MGRARPSTTGSSAGVPPGYGGACFRRSRQQAALRPSSPRQHAHQGAPPRRRRKRGRQIQAIGVSRGGRTTKIHALTDGFGRLVAFCLTAGHVADCRAAEGLLHGLPHRALVMADRAYDTNAIRQQIEQQGCRAEHPAQAHPDLEKLL